MSRPLTLRDTPSQIDFHITHDDYFAYLATLAGFLEEAFALSGSYGPESRERELARMLRRDLRYVQANYMIVPRPPGEIQTIPLKGDRTTPAP